MVGVYKMIDRSIDGSFENSSMSFFDDSSLCVACRLKRKAVEDFQLFDKQIVV